MRFIPITMFWVLVVIEAVKAYYWRRIAHAVVCIAALVSLAANLLWDGLYFTVASGVIAFVALAVSLYGCRENLRDFYIYWIAGVL